MKLRRASRSVLLAAMLFATASAAQAQDAAQFFRQNCASCHTIGGGRITGPDLKDVGRRADREWLSRFLLGPQAVLASGDPYAAKLLQEARGVVMPNVAGMTPALAVALLDLIEQESALPKSQFAGVQISERPFTAADIAQGRQLFRGEVRLASGGPACLSCHAVRGSGGLGGGRLAPDLSKVYERLQGRKGLGTWLNGPPTPTMRGVYGAAPLAESEILPLLAYFEEAARQGGEDDRSGALAFVLLGLGTGAVGLVLMDAAWRMRFRTTRRALVERSRLRRV
jgi:mono/diheme cytochrome c family protein